MVRAPWEEAGEAWHLQESPLRGGLLREGPFRSFGDRNWSAISALVCRRRHFSSPTGVFLRDLLGPFTEKDDEEAYGKGSREGRSLREGPGLTAGSYGSLHRRERRRGLRAGWARVRISGVSPLTEKDDEDAARWALTARAGLPYGDESIGKAVPLREGGRDCPYGKGRGQEKDDGEPLQEAPYGEGRPREGPVLT